MLCPRVKEVVTNPGCVIAVGLHTNRGRLMNMHTPVRCASWSLKDFLLEWEEWQELARAVRKATTCEGARGGLMGENTCCQARGGHEFDPRDPRDGRAEWTSTSCGAVPRKYTEGHITGM
jgi:hypothetical protein|uniref:Uncharacterized protein n=1 Tax=Mus musculus TaxID=10090 RepID=Q3V0Q2_MOUSE|nr:unnamed protein product [Mus musculus]